MQNFEFYNPTRLVFGKGTIAKLAELVPKDARVGITYGGGSIKKNGVFDAVHKALPTKPVAEFGGIEANPDYDTLMKAVKLFNENQVDFVLSVGGGSVLDGSKFIVAAMNWTKTDCPYDIVLKWGIMHDKEYEPHAVCKLADVITLPATGSEANSGAVISWRAKNLKYAFGHPSCFPIFSIEDPETTYSLPAKQVGNGITDAFVHVMEQYACNFQMNSLADEQSEGIMRVLLRTGKDVVEKPTYQNRAEYFWCTTQALNGLISSGVTQDWATHMIGHELTAFYGLDHGQTLALVMPQLLRFELSKGFRREKLTQMAERVFGVKNATDPAEEAIKHMEQFFRSVGMKLKMSELGLDGKHFDEIAKKFETPISTEKNIGTDAVLEILNKCL